MLRGTALGSLALAITFCFSLACFAQSAPDSSAKPPTAFEQTLIANSTAVLEAQKTKDENSLKRLLTADFQQVGSEGKLHKAEELLDDTKEGKLQDYRVYAAQVLAIDESCAIVTYDAVIRMPEGDDGLAPRYQHFSDVWVKQGEQWRLRFQQSTARRPID